MQNVNLFPVFLATLVAGNVSRIVQECRERREPLLEELDRLVMSVSMQSMTPEAALAFEESVGDLLQEIGRVTVETVYNNVEPDEPESAPKQVECDGYEYSRKKSKSRNREGIGTLFGKIELKRFSYEPLQEARDDDRSSIAPLELCLGIVAGNATPALAKQVGALAAGHTQDEVREILVSQYKVHWSVTVLRDVTAAVAAGIDEWLYDVQKSRLLKWLHEADASRGRYKVAFCVGRDGIMVPIRGEKKYKEAAVATLSVYDRRGRRLGTVYLGQMPEEYQSTLSRELTEMIRGVLTDWTGRDPRLVYVTDAGYHPTEYFENVLCTMDDPRHPGRQLEWTWIVDFYHAAGYLGQLAEVLFDDHRKKHAWLRRMRHRLKHEKNAVFRILHSAARYASERTLSTNQQKTYDKAYNYLNNHKPWMDYCDYRRKRLPIGSGVTEAGCKTVFTQRFKEAGMSWKLESGSAILKLRLACLSGVWDEVYRKYIGDCALPTVATKSQSEPPNYAKAA